MKNDLVGSYKIRTEIPDCHPGSTSFSIFITFEDDITEVLPYLNAVLAGELDYRHKDAILLWEAGGKNHVFRAHEIAIASFQENEDDAAYAKMITDKIDEIWGSRETITPSTEGIGPLPSALDIFKILPRTNCKKCGSPTCMAYAVELRSDPTRISSCPFLSAADFKKVLPKK
jgi:ArsR family metal-binding transcriptional regulator